MSEKKQIPVYDEAAVIAEFEAEQEFKRVEAQIAAKREELQIEAWKKEHGDVFEIEVDGRKCWLKRPARKDLSYANTVAPRDGIKYDEIILKACWLGGDEEIKTNDELFMAVGKVMTELISDKKAEIKKV